MVTLPEKSVSQSQRLILERSSERSRRFSSMAGGGMAGLLELTMFHPIDTMVKRCMTSQQALRVPEVYRLAFTSEGQRTLSAVLFQDIGGFRGDGVFLARIHSLFAGLGYGYLYKISQRAYQFGMQREMTAVCTTYFQPETSAGKTAVDAIAGALMGAGEVVLLPFNTLKIRAQTNAAFRDDARKDMFSLRRKPGHEQWAGGQRVGNTRAYAAESARPMWRIRVPCVLTLMRQMGPSRLYAAWGWTLLRNIPGSFAIFGGNAFVKEYVFGLKTHYADAAWWQLMVSSAFGSLLSLLIANPFDVIKTRVQSDLFQQTSQHVHQPRHEKAPAAPMSFSLRPSRNQGLHIARHLYQSEGIRGFFRGSLLKCATVGPKLTFSYTVAQWIIGLFERGS